MTGSLNDKNDSAVQQILKALEPYRRNHPEAKIDVRRQNSVAIRVRIIDPDFEGLDWVDREPEPWKLLKTLPEEVFLDLTMLLCLAPSELDRSLANMEFDDPIPSRL